MTLTDLTSMMSAPTPEQQVSNRAMAAMDQWPTLDAAWGCENCKALMRATESGRCIHCGSEATFDAAAVVGRRGVVSEERLLPLVEALDEALGADVADGAGADVADGFSKI